MNQIASWQRRNTAQVVMIILLIAGFGLLFWSEKIGSASLEHTQKLNDYFDTIRTDIHLCSDALRGIILKPANEADKKRYRDADLELHTTLDSLQLAANNPALATAANSLREFLRGPRAAFHNRVIELAATDPPQAAEYYNRNGDDSRSQRDRLVNALAAQVQTVTNAESLAAQKRALIAVAFTAIIFAAFIVVGWMQSHAVAKPLNQLVSALDRLRQGDFTKRIEMKRRDEFGVLADGLNRLADDLSGLVGQVQKSGIQVNMTATEIAATAREQQSTANEIAATTAEIGATSKQISATSRELVKTMNEVSHVAEDTTELANSGQTSINRMENNMRQIMDASSSITAKLSVLSEKTANINSVVTTITKVADQTNLLSLNAAIEAEKAGEYGLGFAVVAMEIRRLADQTAVATYDIEKMVKEMQSAVAAGVMGMDKFSEEVRRGVEDIRQVSTQLAQIIHQVQALTPRFQTVNDGMTAQATGAQQISETLIQLNEAAQQTAESLRQSNIAIDQLNEAARGLQTGVARFKLEA